MAIRAVTVLMVVIINILRLCFPVGPTPGFGVRVVYPGQEKQVLSGSRGISVQELTCDPNRNKYLGLIS